MVGCLWGCLRPRGSVVAGAPRGVGRLAEPDMLGRNLGRAIRRFLADERATSDVEYILLTALIVVPLCLSVPPLIISANADFYHRAQPWIDLPFP